MACNVFVASGKPTELMRLRAAFAAILSRLDGPGGGEMAWRVFQER